MTGRGLAGRRLATLLLFDAIALDVLVALLFVTAPDTVGPMISSPPGHIWIVPAIGIGLNLAGLIWMVRVRWAIRDSERRPSPWRFSRRST